MKFAIVSSINNCLNTSLIKHTEIRHVKHAENSLFLNITSYRTPVNSRNVIFVKKSGKFKASKVWIHPILSFFTTLSIKAENGHTTVLGFAASVFPRRFPGQ